MRGSGNGRGGGGKCWEEGGSGSGREPQASEGKYIFALK